MQYKQVKDIDGLECSSDGQFRYNGKPKKAIYCHTALGRKATVRLIASTWLRGYDENDRKIRRVLVETMQAD